MVTASGVAERGVLRPERHVDGRVGTGDRDQRRPREVVAEQRRRRPSGRAEADLRDARVGAARRVVADVGDHEPAGLELRADVRRQTAPVGAVQDVDADRLRCRQLRRSGRGRAGSRGSGPVRTVQHAVPDHRRQHRERDQQRDRRQCPAKRCGHRCGSSGSGDGREARSDRSWAAGGRVTGGRLRGTPTRASQRSRDASAEQGMRGPPPRLRRRDRRAALRGGGPVLCARSGGADEVCGRRTCAYPERWETRGSGGHNLARSGVPRRAQTTSGTGPDPTWRPMAARRAGPPVGPVRHPDPGTDENDTNDLRS